MVLKKRIERILRRIFHKKKRRVSGKEYQRIIDAHMKLHYDMIKEEKTMTVAGQDYDAAVEKFQEFMMVKSAMETKGVVEMGEAPLTKTDIYDDIPVIRVSKIPKFLVSLGIRING